jgi:hypothetical protein
VNRLRNVWCLTVLGWLAGFPCPAHSQSIWLSPKEIAALPTSGVAWAQLKEAADSPAGRPDLSDQSQNNNVYVLAKALVYARTGEELYRDEVIRQCRMAIGTETGGYALPLARELCAYVIAADLVQFREPEFEDWLRTCLTEDLNGRTLISTHERRPNNWGTHAGASRLAVALYLNDTAQIERCAEVFRGWLGDPEADVEFRFDRDQIGRAHV